MSNKEYTTTTLSSAFESMKMYNLDLTIIGELFFEFDNLTCIVLKNLDKYIHTFDSNYIRAIISLLTHELKQTPYFLFRKLSDMIPPVSEPDMTQSLYRLLNHFMIWREDTSNEYEVYQFLLELIYFYRDYDCKYQFLSSN